MLVETQLGALEIETLILKLSLSANKQMDNNHNGKLAMAIPVNLILAVGTTAIIAVPGRGAFRYVGRTRAVFSRRVLPPQPPPAVTINRGPQVTNKPGVFINTSHH